MKIRLTLPAQRAAPRLRALICALPLALGASLCHAQLRADNPAGSMIVPPATSHNVSFSLSPDLDSADATLTVRVYPYDDDGRVIRTAVATYRHKVNGSGRGETIQTTLAGLRAGLYRIDAEVDVQETAPLARAQVNLAVVPKRTTPTPHDFGVDTHFAQTTDSPALILPLVKQAGFSWIRDEMYWQQLEKTPGTFTFPARYSDYLSQAVNLGISPLIVLDYGNKSAYPALFAKSQFPDTDQKRQLFARYVSEAVKHYGNLVKHWEVWNEPNFGEISYDNYLALLKVTYAAVKQQAPNATVISCGGGGSGGGPGADCATAIIDRGGLNDQDGFSVHPYMPPNPPETGYKAQGAPIDAVSIPTTWPYLKDFAHDRPRKDGRTLSVWITELGWPVNPKVPGQDEATQAANLIRSYLLSRRYDAVKALFWYDFIDDGTDPNNYEHNFGMLHHDLTPKPAFVGAAVLATTLGERAWNRALVDQPDVKAFQYGTANDTIIAGWTVGADPRTVSLPLPAGQYIQRDWQGGESTVTVTNGQPLAWRVGPLPRYLIPARAAQ